MAGCTTQDLPESWRPITTLIERGDTPGVGEGIITTISPYLYTDSIDKFNEYYPEGSISHEALRRHELEHARDQEAYIGDATGVLRKSRITSWIYQYIHSKEFRWNVEKKGYKAEILYLKRMNMRISPAAYAFILSGETYRGMVSTEDALNWVNNVLAGKE